MAEWPCCHDPLRSSPASHGFVPPPSTPIQKFRLGRMMLGKDDAPSAVMVWTPHLSDDLDTLLRRRFGHPIFEAVWTWYSSDGLDIPYLRRFGHPTAETIWTPWCSDDLDISSTHWTGHPINTLDIQHDTLDTPTLRSIGLPISATVWIPHLCGGLDMGNYTNYPFSLWITTPRMHWTP